MNNTHSSSGYSKVLQIKGFQPFLWTQFLNAFNDNVYKLTVSLLAVAAGSKTFSAGDSVSLAGFIFAAPFLLFSGYAGQLADRFEKRTVVVMTKAFEIAAMIFALFALMSGDLNLMLAVLFFTATQAAFFSPAKYGIVPEMVDVSGLSSANGLLEMSTFVAIILGTVGGSVLVAAWKQQTWAIGLVLIGTAILGTLVSLRIARTPAPAQKRPFSWNPFGDVFAGIERLRGDRTLLFAVLGTTYFWFLGALFQMLLILFSKETLHCGEAETGLLMASLAIGIGAGSMAAGRLSGERVEPGLIPIGALGMAVGSTLLAYSVHSVWAAAITLIGTGFLGGLFVVPLNAILQHRPRHDEKGRLLATASFVNTTGVLLASAVVEILHSKLHFTAAQVIGVSAILTTLCGLLCLQLVPRFTARFILWMLTHAIYKIRILGGQNIPRKGAALLVANHVSYVDGFLISACIQRIVRFMVFEVWYDRFAAIFSRFHAIRVPVSNRRGIIHAIEAARKELEAGHVVCIFAEGALTQTGNIAEFHRGLERIVAGVEFEGKPVPVIPVHLDGAWDSIFSLNRRASLWNSLRQLPFPIRVSFGAAMQNPTAEAVRSAVMELGADAAHAAIDDRETLALRIIRSAKRNWTRRALTDSTGKSLTYGQTLTAALLVADNFHREHRQEQRIGVMLPASTAAAIVNLGIVQSGRNPVNLNFTIGKEPLESAISQCELRTIVTSRQFLAKIKIDPRPEMIFVEDMLHFSGAGKAIAYARARLLPSRTLAPQGHADDLAAILFSSGSSGAPKGVMLSHRNLISNASSVHQLFPVSNTDTIIGVLPLFHSFGFTYTLWFPLLHGASVAYHAQPLDARGLGELVVKTRATILPAAPAFCQAYLRICTKDQFATIKHVLVGAEKLPTLLADGFREKFGLELLEGYGATEMSPVISVNIPDRVHNGTVGQLIPGVAGRVLHPETGEALPSGHEGLLVVRGPNRMLGYWKQPTQTEAALRHGWYITGDIVVMDAEGFIRIVGRQSRFSKIAGEMVPHGRIEEALQAAYPGLAAVVTGVPDDRRGERLVALVSAKDTLNSQDVWQALMNSGLPKIWIPKAEDIHLVDSIPLLGSGKVDLLAARKQAQAA